MAETGATSRPRKRRRPRQERSKETVDAILEGTAQVLKESGYGQLTTRRIADRAGVSVGSMYQYFPSKEAVVIALAEAHRAAILAQLQSAIDATAGRSLTERAPVLVRALLDAKTEDPDLNAMLTSAMLEIDGPCYLSKDTEPFRKLVLELLVEHAAELHTDDPELTSFVLVRAIEGVLSGVAAGDDIDEERLGGALLKLVLGILG